MYTAFCLDAFVNVDSSFRNFKYKSINNDSYGFAFLEDFYIVVVEYLPMLAFLTGLIISYRNLRKKFILANKNEFLPPY